MWAEFEWENKVTVNTNIADLRDFLEHVMSMTNLKCLTPEKVGLTDKVGPQPPEAPDHAWPGMFILWDLDVPSAFSQRKNLISNLLKVMFCIVNNCLKKV